ncbi:MAG: hypothetical protein GYB67_08910, partial [Chloroflexi bacterium]|nr:hypothetical protein [Chloroflexota bacterium]
DWLGVLGTQIAIATDAADPQARFGDDDHLLYLHKPITAAALIKAVNDLL